MLYKEAGMVNTGKNIGRNIGSTVSSFGDILSKAKSYLKPAATVLGKGVEEAGGVVGSSIGKGVEKAGKGVGEGVGQMIEGATKGLGTRVGLGVLGATGIPYAGYKTLGYLFNPPAQDSVAAEDFAKLMQAKAFLLQARQKIENQKMENLLKAHVAGVPLYPPQQEQLVNNKFGSENMRGIGVFGYQGVEKVAARSNFRVIEGGKSPKRVSPPTSKPSQPFVPTKHDPVTQSYLKNNYGYNPPYQPKERISAPNDLSKKVSPRGGSTNFESTQKNVSDIFSKVQNQAAAQKARGIPWGTVGKWGAGIGGTALGAALLYKLLSGGSHPQPQYPMYPGMY